MSPLKHSKARCHLKINYNIFISPLAASSSSSDQSFPLSSSLPISSSNSARIKIRNKNQKHSWAIEHNVRPVSCQELKKTKPQNLFLWIHNTLMQYPNNSLKRALSSLRLRKSFFTLLSSDVQRAHSHPLVKEEFPYLTPPRSSLFPKSIPLEKTPLLHLSLMERTRFLLHPRCLQLRHPTMTGNYFEGKWNWRKKRWKRKQRWRTGGTGAVVCNS